MSATFTGPQKSLGPNLGWWLSFFNFYFAPHKTITWKAASTQCPFLMHMLCQHYQALWPNHNIVTKHDGQNTHLQCLWPRPSHLLFFNETFQSFVRKIQIFLTFFVLGHFCMPEKGILIEWHNFVRSLEKLSQRPKN